MTGRDISHPEDLEVINTQRTRLYAGEMLQLWETALDKSDANAPDRAAAEG